MPVRSERHNRMMWTVEEAGQLLSIPLRSLRRLIADARARGELCEDEIKVPGKRGRPALCIDLMTLGLALNPAQLGTQFKVSEAGTKTENLVPDFSATAGIECQPASTPTGSGVMPLSALPSPGNLVPRKKEGTPGIECHTELSGMEVLRRDPALLLAEVQGVTYRDTDPAAARSLHADILPALNARAGSRERGQAVRAIAKAKAVDESTVRDWITRYEEEGLTGLQPKQRKDKGAFRLPQATLQLICACIVTNPATTSTRKLYQTLMLAVPDAMVTRRAGRAQQVSLATVSRIREMLMAHPQMRLMMLDTDQRREYMRTYMGRVLAAHANDMWQQDMTRCDVLVYDTETETYYRPRVQAVIDVFSGAIPGIGFSPDEDQVQADLAFFRALTPPDPRSPIAAHYPIYGRPRRIYIDNGSTYSSHHFERVARELGIEMIHSRPWVSHTRGAIERFFRTLHLFEATLPGYVGQDAANRSSDELARLTAATRRWQETGRDPGEGQRLMTLREYQIAVLRWLIVDYHQTVVDGRTRLEWFTSTAPASSLATLDLGELLVHFAQRVERIVTPECTVTVDGVRWACLGGELGSYAGTRVVVLHDAMVLGDDVRVIALRERAGHLRILGHAVRAPDNAMSIEAGELRRINKLAKRGALDVADEMRTSITDPALLVRRQHERQLPVVPVAALPEPTARARLSSVTPEPTPDLGDFGRSFLRAEEPTDMAAFMASLTEE